MPLPNEKPLDRDDQALLELGGGLKGRMSSAFCVLQSAVDAIELSLQNEAPAALRRQLAPVLTDMAKNIAYLSRLSANAADMALARTGAPLTELSPLDLNDCLRTLARCAQEEFAARKIPATLAWAENAGDSVWVMGDVGLIDGLFANLISNAVRAGTAGRAQHLACGPGREAHFWDDGPGMDAKTLRVCLLEGQPTPESLRSGSLGLLLVHEYAAKLGWQLDAATSAQGTRIDFRLPPFEIPADLSPYLHASGRHTRQDLQRSHLRRELDGTLGTAR